MTIKLYPYYHSKSYLTTLGIGGCGLVGIWVMGFCSTGVAQQLYRVYLFFAYHVLEKIASATSSLSYNNCCTCTIAHNTIPHMYVVRGYIGINSFKILSIFPSQNHLHKQCLALSIGCTQKGDILFASHVFTTLTSIALWTNNQLKQTFFYSLLCSTTISKIVWEVVGNPNQLYCRFPQNQVAK
mgnify:CR=1 FL=1